MNPAQDHTPGVHHDSETVFVVDDDELIQRYLLRLLVKAGYQVKLFSSADEFLAQLPPPELSCAILDINLPGLSGIELQGKLQSLDVSLPIVFFTGHGEVPHSVQAMKCGAEDFLCKSAEPDELLDAVQRGLRQARKRRIERMKHQTLSDRAESLTSREREIYSYLIGGLLNKQIAYHLDIAERTVKAHRARIFEKMGAHSVVELYRAAEKIGIQPASEPND